MGVELLGGVDQGYPGLSALDAEIGVVGCGRWVGEQVVDLAGDVAFQTSDDFSTGLAFFLASLDVCDRSLVVSHPGDGNVPEGAVGFTVPSPMLLWLSNRVLVGCEAGEPLLVLGGEVVVVAAASFELGEEGGVGLERLGGVGEGDVGLLA